MRSWISHFCIGQVVAAGVHSEEDEVTQVVDLAVVGGASEALGGGEEGSEEDLEEDDDYQDSAEINVAELLSDGPPACPQYLVDSKPH